MKELQIWTDGGARGNPGPAAIGVVIKEGDAVVESFGRTIGETTNNRAEYAALAAALEAAAKLGATHLICNLDSKLVVEQVKGNYKVKNAGLRESAATIAALTLPFASIRYVTIPREENTAADTLVNQALDAEA